MPFEIEDLEVKPPLKAKPPVTDNLQQTLSTLVGYTGRVRRLLKVSPTGVLYMSSPRVKGIVNVTASGDNDTWQGDNIQCTDILVKAKHTNVGLIWVMCDLPAAADVGVPLDAGEFIEWNITNLVNLYLLIEKDTEKAVVVYSQ